MRDDAFEDVFVTDGFPEPLNHLNASLNAGEDLRTGAAKCAEFFKKFEEHAGVERLCLKLLEPSIPRRWLEYVLFSMLDVGFPYLQVAEQALRLKCLRRVVMRAESGVRLSEEETSIARELRDTTGIARATDLLSWAYRARDFVVGIIKGAEPDARGREMIAYLIRAEVRSLKERIERISEIVDVYDLRQMARVLPRIRRFDENARDAGELADEIERGAALGKRALTFETEMGGPAFASWLRALDKEPRLGALRDVIVMQREKLAPTRSIVALSTLWRWILEAQHRRVDPLEWIGRALGSYQSGRFTADAGAAISQLDDFVANSGAWIEGSVVSGNFSDRLYSQWIDHDMLTRPFEAGEAERQAEEFRPDYREIIVVHIHNDKLIERLLDNAKVYESLGLVELIVNKTRSVSILTKVATHNHLYSGSANANVPQALLRHPSKIPIDLLRPFVRRSFFTVPELRTLLKEADLRPEVVKEIKQFLGTAIS